MLAHNSTVVLSMESSRFLNLNFYLGLMAWHWPNRSEKGSVLDIEKGVSS
jgi:hypothetical protein